MPAPELAGRLNEAGYRTSYGTESRGGRGTYRLVKSTYDELMTQGRREEAEAVAESFTKPDGTHAYE